MNSNYSAMVIVLEDQTIALQRVANSNVAASTI